MEKKVDKSIKVCRMSFKSSTKKRKYNIGTLAEDTGVLNFLDWEHVTGLTVRWPATEAAVGCSLGQLVTEGYIMLPLYYLAP